MKALACSLSPPRAAAQVAALHDQKPDQNDSKLFAFAEGNFLLSTTAVVECRISMSWPGDFDQIKASLTAAVVGLVVCQHWRL